MLFSKLLRKQNNLKIQVFYEFCLKKLCYKKKEKKKFILPQGSIKSLTSRTSIEKCMVKYFSDYL